MEDIKSRINNAKERIRQQLAQRKISSAEEKIIKKDTLEMNANKMIVDKGIAETIKEQRKYEIDTCGKMEEKDSVNLLTTTSSTKRIPSWRMAQLEEISTRRKVITSSSKSKEEVEKKTRELLSRFTSSIKEASKTKDEKKALSNELVGDAIDKLPCELHLVIGCKSCNFIVTSVEDIDQTEAEHGWKSHKLIFEKEAGERQVKLDAENLMVIDPRSRSELLAKRTKN